MKDEQKKKINIKPIEPEKKDYKQYQEEQEKLFAETDAVSPAQKYIDKAEVIHLQNGTALNLSDYVKDNFVEYYPHFPKQFFYLIAKMFLLPESVMDTWIKPPCVPRFINKFIYGRFPGKVLGKIRYKNNYDENFNRPYKNFQFLTKYADNMLNAYIEDAIKYMDAAANMSEFKSRYMKDFNMPNQITLFGDIMD